MYSLIFKNKGRVNPAILRFSVRISWKARQLASLGSTRATARQPGSCEDGEQKEEECI